MADESELRIAGFASGRCRGFETNEQGVGPDTPIKDGAEVSFFVTEYSDLTSTILCPHVDNSSGGCRASSDKEKRGGCPYVLWPKAQIEERDY